MNIANIFRDCHGAIDKSSLIPFPNLSLIGKVEGLPTKKQIKEIIDYLDIDIKDLYYDPKSILNPIIYLSGFIYMPLYGFDIEGLKMLQVAERLKDMQNIFKEFEEKKDYDSIFQFMDKKILIPKYIELFDKIPNDQRYEIFVALHIRSEYGFEMFSNSFLKKIIFDYQKYSPEYKKRMKELKKKIGKKKEFTIYHGHNENYDPKDDYSWTLKKETAMFFANRFDGNGIVSEKRITFEQVIDFFDQRNEAEIILLTDNLK